MDSYFLAALPPFSLSLSRYYLRRKCKRQIDILPRSIGNRYAEPFFYLKNENWHKLMAALKVCGPTLYSIYMDNMCLVRYSDGASGFWLLWQSGHMYANESA